MPYKPKKPCSYPGCGRLIDPQHRYCKEHEQLVNKNYERYERDHKAMNERYNNPHWHLIRKKYLEEHVFCECCFDQGILTEATEVHHKRPLSKGGTNDEANLQALCKSCHTKIHNRFKGRNRRKY